MFKKIYRSDFLFSSIDFVIGAGSIINLAGNYFDFNSCETSEEADKKAIENDWGVIGQDIQKSIYNKNISTQSI